MTRGIFSVLHYLCVWVIYHYLFIDGSCVNMVVISIISEASILLPRWPRKTYVCKCDDFDCVTFTVDNTIDTKNK